MAGNRVLRTRPALPLLAIAWLSASTSAWSAQREVLPDGVTPIHYDLALVPNASALTYFSTARPAACSGYHSLSRQRCEDAHFNTDTFEGIPMSQAFNYVAAALQGGVDQGLARLGLSAARFELHAAVAALLRNPGTIQRWRSGRTLLKEDGSRAAAGSL